MTDAKANQSLSHPTPSAPGAGPLQPSPVPPVRVTTPADATPSERWLWRGLLLVLCLLAYARSFSTEFLWDDDRHAANWALKTTDGLERIWTRVGIENGGAPQYYPLTHTLFWLETKAFGRSALGYRVTNVLLHVGCAVVLWELLRRLRVRGAYLAAAIFAVHPLMVESVAWTSEQKNTLSLLLGLTALLMYWMFVESDEKKPLTAEKNSAEPEGAAHGPDWNFYLLALLAFAGALLSKTVAATLPVVLLLGLWWKRKLTVRHIGLIAPMIVAGIAMGLFTGYVEHKYVIRPPGSEAETFATYLSAKLSGTLPISSEIDLTGTKRLLLASVTPWFYLSKLIAPIQLVFFYPRWDLGAAPAWWWLGAVGIAVTGLVTIAAALRGVRWPLLVFGAYLAGLFPAMGFFDVYPFRYSYVADHFAYHAAWVLIVAAAAILAWAWERIRGFDANGLKAALAAGSLLLLVLLGRTWVHAGNFIDRYALWSHVIANNPESWAATRGLALEHIYFAEQCEQAMRDARVFNDQKAYDRAVAERKDNLDAAENLLTRVRLLKPDHGWTSFDFGRIYFMRGDLARSKEYFEQAAREDESRPARREGPYAGIYFWLGDIAMKEKDYAAAVRNYRRVIESEKPPMNPPSAYVRIRFLEAAIDEARTRAQATTRAASTTTGPSTLPSYLPTIIDLVEISRQVTTMEPDNYEAWLVSGKLMITLGRLPDAVVAYGQAARLGETIDAFVGLGSALGDMGRYADAEAAFKAALQRDASREDIRRLMLMAQERGRAASRPAATQPLPLLNAPTTLPQP